jgi:GAF domain-containing protein
MSTARAIQGRPWLAGALADRIRRLARMTGAKHFEGRPGAAAIVVILLVGVFGLFFAEVLTPTYFTISSLDLLLVLVAGWLLSARLVGVVTAAALVAQTTLTIIGEIHWITAASYVGGTLAVAAGAHIGAANSAAARVSRERDLALLLQVAKRVSTLASLDEVAGDIVLYAARFVSQGPFGVRARATMFRIVDGAAVVIAEHDDLGATLKDRQYPLDTRFTAVVESGPISLALAELPATLRAAYERAGATSVALAPVAVRGALYGYLAAASRDERQAGAHELNLLKGLADLAGLAISQAERLGAERSRGRLFEALFDLSLAISEASDAQSVADAVVARARDLMSADVALLAFEQRGLLRPSAVYPKRASKVIGFPLRGGVVGEAFQRREPVVAAGRSSFTDASDRALLPKGGSLAAVPVLAGRRQPGVLVVASRKHVFDTQDVDALAVFASQLNPALEAARMRQTLVTSESRFRTLYAGLACGVVIHDAFGNLVDANWAAESLLGVNRKALEHGVFLGPDWRVRVPGGRELPLTNRPPGVVTAIGKPIQKLVVEVAPPGSSPRWLRIDSMELQHEQESPWVVTSFFEVPKP